MGQEAIATYLWDWIISFFIYHFPHFLCVYPFPLPLLSVIFHNSYLYSMSLFLSPSSCFSVCFTLIASGGRVGQEVDGHVSTPLFPLVVSYCPTSAHINSEHLCKNINTFVCVEVNIGNGSCWCQLRTATSFVQRIWLISESFCDILKIRVRRQIRRRWSCPSERSTEGEAHVGQTSCSVQSRLLTSSWARDVEDPGLQRDDKNIRT